MTPIAETGTLMMVCVCGSVEPGRAGHGRQGARVHADLEKEHDEPGTHALQPSRHIWSHRRSH